jgi:CHAT domain-containing protein/tetratricopeptide (TPR) repeat protein
VRVAIVVLAGVLVGGAAPRADAGLERCDRLVRDAPRDMASYRCYSGHAIATGGAAAAAARLEALARERPDVIHARLFLARVLPRDEADRVLELLRQAAEDYRAQDDLAGEGWARTYLLAHLFRMQRFEEAAAEGARAEAIVERLGEPELHAHVLFSRARLAILEDDHGRAWSLLRRLELSEDFAALSPNFRCAVLNLLGITADALGLRRVERQYARRVVELAEREGVESWIAQGVAQLANTSISRVQSGEMSRAEALPAARRAVELAAPGYQRISAEMTLGILAAPDEAVPRLEQVLEVAGSSPWVAFRAELWLAQKLAELDRADDALIHVQRGLEAARATRSPYNLADALAALAEIHFRLGPRDEALASSRATLDAIERLHDLQLGDTAGALTLEIFAPVYFRHVDALLGEDGTDAAARAEAFRVAERLRARALREHVVRAGLRAAAPEGADDPRRLELLSEISRLQLRLFAESLDEEERARLEARRERLEHEERLLRAADVRDAEPGAAGTIARLPAVQEALARDEALLSYLLDPAGEQEGWLMTVTAGAVHVDRVPAAAELAAAERFWLGLLERRDPAAAHGAARLHADLLAAALARLPPQVDRLVIVPDGPLHRLPLDALRARAGAAPLAARYELSITPSASIWLALRQRRGESGATEPVAPRALVFADPRLPAAPRGPATERGGPLASSLGSLPQARVEARAALRALGGEGDLRMGNDASEAALKNEALGRFAVLHLAAHAVVDESEPERSAVLLAPGAGAEDGLLQAREIAQLDLADTVVTLSACRSADGAVFAGEGVLGLARAFFQAGSRTVVGSYWPLRDDEAATLMRTFYDRLGRGESVGTALAGAKRTLLAEQAPPAAWAGLVVLGDAAAAPWPRADHAAATAFDTVAIATILALALLATTVAALLRRHPTKARRP